MKLRAREKNSQAQKKRFENPEEQEKQSQAQKKRFENPEEQEKTSQAVKKYFETPGAREKQSQTIKKYFENSEAREKHSQAIKKYFETPGAREKASQAAKKCKGTPEAREKISQVQINNRSIFYTLDQLIKNNYCYLWTEELRETIRVRDNYICQECSKTELENNRKLSVHHIHYKKEDCYPDLITLCGSCHAKANFNRDYWENRFMNKINDLEFLFWLQYNKD